MNLRKKGLLCCLLIGAMTITPVCYGVQASSTDQPLAINYSLDQVEDTLEKEFDKQHKIDWDFEIVYHDGKVFLMIEYDKADAKKFNKRTEEDLHKFVIEIIKRINKSMKKDTEITGVIQDDDAQTPTYSFH